MGENDGWRAQLPETQRDNEAFTGFEKIGDFADDYLSTKESVSDLQGKLDNSIPKLSDNPTDEEKAAFLTAMGRPEEVGGYEFNRPSELPEGIDYSDEVEASFKAKFHELGLSSQQASGLYDHYMNFWLGGMKAELDNREAASKTASDALKTEMGAEYTANMALMDKAVMKFGGDEFKKYMDDSKMGNDAAIIKTFINIGKAMSEDTLILGDKGADDRPRGPDGRVQLTYENSPEMKT